MSTHSLDSLTSQQQVHVEKCMHRLTTHIQAQGGCLAFDEYMQIVLHDPEVGYYHRQTEIFGEAGDFTTAPEFSVHLAYCLAHACTKLIRDDAERCILEIGAGSGRLAGDVLTYLEQWGQIPKQYFIYEPSAALRTKQKNYFEKIIPQHLARIQWLSDLTDKQTTTIIIANEVIDVLPVKCFAIQDGQLKEKFVTLDETQNLTWTLQSPTEQLDTALDYITVMTDQSFAEGYSSEVNIELESVLSAWTQSSEQCVLFIIDYGYPLHEYYHSQRMMGTLRSYFQHQMTASPLENPGLQDITADVNFSALAKAAEYLQLGVLSFGSQRNFMLANHLLEWRPLSDNEADHISQIAQLKQLTLGSEMSERFQVMVLGKGIEYGADRFTMRDMRTRL